MIEQTSVEQLKRQIIECTREIQSTPENAILYKHRGNAKYCLQQYEEAIKDYTQAIQLDPNDVIAYKNRSLSYAAIKDQNRVSGINNRNISNVPPTNDNNSIEPLKNYTADDFFDNISRTNENNEPDIFLGGLLQKFKQLLIDNKPKDAEKFWKGTPELQKEFNNKNTKFLNYLIDISRSVLQTKNNTIITRIFTRVTWLVQYYRGELFRNINIDDFTDDFIRILKSHCQALIATIWRNNIKLKTTLNGLDLNGSAQVLHEVINNDLYNMNLFLEEYITWLLSENKNANNILQAAPLNSNNKNIIIRLNIAIQRITINIQHIQNNSNNISRPQTPEAVDRLMILRHEPTHTNNNEPDINLGGLLQKFKQLLIYNKPKNAENFWKENPALQKEFNNKNTKFLNDFIDISRSALQTKNNTIITRIFTSVNWLVQHYRGEELSANINIDNFIRILKSQSQVLIKKIWCDNTKLQTTLSVIEDVTLSEKILTAVLESSITNQSIFINEYLKWWTSAKKKVDTLEVIQAAMKKIPPIKTRTALTKEAHLEKAMLCIRNNNDNISTPQTSSDASTESLEDCGIDDFFDNISRTNRNKTAHSPTLFNQNENPNNKRDRDDSNNNEEDESNKALKRS